MNAHPGRETRPPDLDGPLVTMFETGKLCNEVRWLIYQAFVLANFSICEETREILRKMAYRFTRVSPIDQIFPIDQAEKICDSLLQIGNEFRFHFVEVDGELYHCHSSAIGRFNRMFGPLPKRGQREDECPMTEVFKELLEYANLYDKSIREVVELQIEGQAEWKEALHLGMCVDQGLRPLDLVENLRQWKLDPAYWSWKRSSEYRYQVRSHQRAIALLPQPNGKKDVSFRQACLNRIG